MSRLLTFVIAGFFGLHGTALASAAQHCGTRDKIVEALGQKYHENRQSLGLASGLAVVELYASFKGTWTILATDTNGRACIIASGEDWQAAPRVVAGLGS